MPNFKPSPEAYASSVEVFEGLRKRFASRGIEDSGALELWTFLMTGITARQIANDPDGDRYAHHLDTLVSSGTPAKASIHVTKEGPRFPPGPPQDLQD